MAKILHKGHEKRRSARYDKRFLIILEHEGNSHEIRTLDISEHGALVPKRLPPNIGDRVKMTLTIREETSTFEGVVMRHTKCVVNGVKTTGIGIDFSSPEYQGFVKDKILIN